MSINGIIILAGTALSALLGCISYRTRKTVLLLIEPSVCLIGAIASILIYTNRWSLVSYTENARSAPDYVYGISDSWGAIVSLVISVLISAAGYFLVKTKIEQVDGV